MIKWSKLHVPAGLEKLLVKPEHLYYDNGVNDITKERKTVK